MQTIDQTTARQAIFALLDVLDGQQDHDIRAMTSLPEARCAEIAALHSRLFTEYGRDWLNGGQ